MSRKSASRSTTCSPSFWQAGWTMHELAWATQAPEAEQVPKQDEVSPHTLPATMGVWVTPVTGSHASSVQSSPSPRAGGAPGAQAPPWQVSLPLHRLASAQLV